MAFFDFKIPVKTQEPLTVRQESGVLVRRLILVKNPTYPPKGKKWIVVTGVINHITGSETYVAIQDTMNENEVVFVQIIPAASPTQSYMMDFSFLSNQNMEIYTSDFIIVVTLSVAYVVLRVLEVDA